MVHADIAPADAPEYREMPHNEDAEQALLGAVLVNNAVLDRIEDFLAPEHFFVPVHGRIYEAIRRVAEKGQVANPITLKAYFENDEALDAVGGATYLARLASSAATIANAREYALQVHEHHARRRLIEIGQDMVADAFEPSVDDAAEDQIERAEKSLFELAETGRHDRDFRDFRDVAEETLKAMKAAHQKSGMAGVATGLRDLDDFLGGLHRSDLVILAARTGMGKTAFATNVSFDAARRHRTGVDEAGNERVEDGAVVGFFSLEMSAEQLVGRILAEESGIPSHLLRRGDIHASEFGAVVRASHEIARIPLYIDDTPALTIGALRTRARRLKRRQGLSLVVVDYLQLVRPSGRTNADNRVQEVSEVTQGLKALAKEIDAPVLALSQLSRAVEQRDDKRPLLSDLRESGSIEQDADVVMFLYREDYYLKRQEPRPKAGEAEDDPKFRERLENWQARMADKEGITEVIVAKQRHGPTGDVEIQFRESTTKYADLETRYSPDDGFG